MTCSNDMLVLSSGEGGEFLAWHMAARTLGAERSYIKFIRSEKPRRGGAQLNLIELENFRSSCPMPTLLASSRTPF
jgi:hypothetical protein